ncbi:MAG: NAD(P)/FAD-dependent oxidoreductase [Acidobacteriota bacterium]
MQTIEKLKIGSTETINIAIIGGGVVGLAIAAELSRHVEDVFLIEALPRVGTGTSTRNSGVIHAGIYYPPDSLKAMHAVRGARLLYEFCDRHRVPHRRTGKLIVIDSADQIDQLDALKRRGEENGVEGLEIISRASIRKLEPQVASPYALWSPNTGILEAEELIKTLARLALRQGAHILTNARLIAAEVDDGAARLRTEREEFASRVVINAAGLYADEVARLFGYDQHRIYACRGEYAEVIKSRSDIVRHLVYPLPLASGHGTGVHFTKTLAGVVLVGPNARYVRRKDDYENDRAPLESFYESASHIIPSLRLEDLRLSYSGLRARLLPEHDHSFADFVITHDPRWPRVIHLIGIESPGLTSALSIAASVSEMAIEALG